MDKLSMYAQPNIQQFVDNALRSNTALQRTQQKEEKKLTATVATGKKAVKEGGIDSATVDSSDMGNLGDLRGSSTSEDLYQDTFHKNLDKESTFLSQDISILSKEQNIEDEEELVLPEEENEQEEEDKEKDSKEDKVTLSQEDKKQEEGEKIPPEGEAEKVDDKVELSFEELLQVASTSNLGQGILLEMDEEEFKKVSTQVKAEEVEVRESLTYSSLYTQQQSSIEKIKKMLLPCVRQELIDVVIAQLIFLPEQIITTCMDFGVKIKILLNDESVSNISQEIDDEVRLGYYIPQKLCFIGAEWLEKDFPFLPAVYCLAYAFDHSTGKDGFASLNSPVVINNFYACKRQEAGCKFADKASASNPVDYFAQSIAAFCQVDYNANFSTLSEKLLQTPLLTKEELFKDDKNMYHYIDYLFNR